MLMMSISLLNVGPFFFDILRLSTRDRNLYYIVEENYQKVRDSVCVRRL